MDVYDVVILGSSIDAVTVTSLLHKSGRKVILIDSSRRLGQRLCYLPITNLLLEEGLLKLPRRYLRRAGEPKVMLELIDGSVRAPLRVQLFVMEHSAMCDALACLNDFDLFLWSKVIRLIPRDSSTEIEVKTPTTGRQVVKARLVVDSRPLDDGYTSAYVATGTPKGGGSKLRIDDLKVSLEVVHDGVATLVSTSRIYGGIASSQVSSRRGEKVGYGGECVIPLGENAGHALAPWLGDSLLTSAYATYSLVSCSLEGKGSSSEAYVAMDRLAESYGVLHSYASKGKLSDIPAAMLEEILNPYSMLRPLRLASSATRRP